ncbi:MAG: DUF362 domain-containing protein [Desulfobacterales bacterium]|jgi:hypothetical protein|nr:DUF362 domain-containing protein [Desulfobacterales bacterium]
MGTRRQFIRNSAALIGAAMLWPRKLGAVKLPPKETAGAPTTELFRAVNGTPQANTEKLIDLMGGVRRLVGPEDVVLIKPNVQWWNQGAPSLGAVKCLVDLIMNRPGGFCGEVVLAENCHRGAAPWQHAGWSTPFERNADCPGADNYNDLCRLLKRDYGDRFSAIHWVNVKDGGRRVSGPAEGTGYVFCDGTRGVPLLEFNNGLDGERFRAVIMTYPVFQTDRGTRVDFRHGIWEQGGYSERPFKFFNLVGLNHHSVWCGVTAAVKNYLGITDLSGGPDPHRDGKLTGSYYNFHSFPFDEWAPGPKPGMIGAEIAVFLGTVRRADLNIATAEWVGLAHRTLPPAARTRAVLAATDPVALDYHAAKYILYPNSGIKHHNPDYEAGAFHHYLKECADRGGGVLDERQVRVLSYDLSRGAMQTDGELAVAGEKTWGRDGRSILKYLVLRYL